MENELNNDYFEWMYQLVCDQWPVKHVSYRKLLMYLHTKDFVYSIGMDKNRAEDGMDLRYRFGDEFDIPDPIIATVLDNRPCSIFEMMLALSIRCEEHIMDDPDVGNRTGQWFWGMVINLGLDSMTDSKFDKRVVDQVIDRLLNHEYRKNGEGGLFTVNRLRHDMRSTEIWYQAMWYLDEVLNLP